MLIKCNGLTDYQEVRAPPKKQDFWQFAAVESSGVC